MCGHEDAGRNTHSRGTTSALKNKKDSKPHHITVHNLPSIVLSSCTSQFLKDISFPGTLAPLSLFISYVVESSSSFFSG